MTLKGQGYRGLYRRTDRESKIDRERETPGMHRLSKLVLERERGGGASWGVQKERYEERRSERIR